MSETHKEQAAFLENVNTLMELPEVNKELFRTYSAVSSIKAQFANVFSEIALYEERMIKLKERARVLFDIEDVKTLPDSEYHGTLTKVAGKRYIPIKKAQEMLDPRTYASLVETGRGYVKWTPPKESNK